ncbi:ABC transporter substrate-binding protein [Hydrogenophilus islandicus]
MENGKRRLWLKGAWTALLALPMVGWGMLQAAAGEPQDPVALVQNLSDQVLSYLKSNPVTDERSREAFVAFVEKTVLPHFDMARMTSLAVGPAWRQATAEQRQRLTAEFQKLLLRTYSNAAREYRDERLEFLPERRGANDPYVRVAARIVRSGAEPIDVQYVLENRDGAWKIFDVVIAGVSLVTNYRGSFTAEINRSGIDGLIRLLADKNARGETDPVPGKSTHG